MKKLLFLLTFFTSPLHCWTKKFLEVTVKDNAGFSCKFYCSEAEYDYILLRWREYKAGMSKKSNLYTFEEDEGKYLYLDDIAEIKAEEI